MPALDIGIVVVYILACTLMGSWLGRGSKDLKGYFLGEKDAPMWAIMISIIATETSTVTFLSVPSLSCRPGGDMQFLQLALGYIVGRVLVATLLLPMYFRGEIYSAYQVLGQRFGPSTKTTASLLFLAMRTLGDGIRLAVTAGVVHLLTGLSMPVSILVMGGTTILYTFIGGMKAVIWTDVVQFFVYLAGGIFALGLLLNLEGGWTRIASDPGRFHVFDFGWSWSDPLTFWAGLFGGAILSMATHGADQLMVQRYLSSRSRGQASTALILSGFIVFAQFALFLVIGVALAAYYRGGELPPKDQEFSTFLLSPDMVVGVRGLIIAGIFAAAMSTLSSSLSASASTTVSDLLFPRLRPQSPRRQVIWSRALTAFWGVAQMGVAWWATLSLQSQAINNVLAIASLGAGLLLGVFLLGLACPDCGEAGSLVALLVGAGIVVSVRQFTPLAWPWHALVGSSSVLAVGWLASRLVPSRKPPYANDLS